MNRRQKVLALVERIEAAERGPLKKKKAEREAEERERDESLGPDEYREKHGRCPNGYEYDVLTDKCEPKEGEEAREDRAKREKQKPEQEERDETKPGGQEGEDVKQPKKPMSPKERRKYLRELFDKDFKDYQAEVKRMRETGELPDRETSKLLAQIDNPDELPDDILNDREKLARIVQQQNALREHEELILKKTQEALQDVRKQRERAERIGKKPPVINVVKLLQQIEEQYGRPLEVSHELEEMMQRNEELLPQLDLATNPAEPSYWMKRLFHRITKPIPRWTPFSAKSSHETLSAVLDEVAEQLEERGSRQVERIDVAAEVLTGPERVVARTSSDVTRETTDQIGFPPYDGNRKQQHHIERKPSGRKAFPPYDEYKPPQDRARDAKMKGFPPYDGKGEVGDDKTVGLPPYNKKPPHIGRGFPPFHDGRNVYQQRRETVKKAVD